MLADAANIAYDLMSKYCTIDPETMAPRLLPPRHAIMKIIAVLGVTPEDANEVLELAGYCINRADSIQPQLEPTLSLDLEQCAWMLLILI